MQDGIGRPGADGRCEKHDIQMPAQNRLERPKRHSERLEPARSVAGVTQVALGGEIPIALKSCLHGVSGWSLTEMFAYSASTRVLATTL